MLKRTFAPLLAVFLCQVSLAGTPETLTNFKVQLDVKASSSREMDGAGRQSKFIATAAEGEEVYYLIPTEGGTASTLLTKYREAKKNQAADRSRTHLPITISGTRVLQSDIEQEGGVDTYHMHVYTVHQTMRRATTEPDTGLRPRGLMTGAGPGGSE